MATVEVWTLIGLLATFSLGGLGFLFKQLGRFETSAEKRFDRFETSIGQRFGDQAAAFGASLGAVTTSLKGLESKMDERFQAQEVAFDRLTAEMDRGFTSVNGRLDRVETRLDRVEEQVGAVRVELSEHLAHHAA